MKDDSPPIPPTNNFKPSGANAQQAFPVPTPCTVSTHASDSKFSDAPTFRSVAVHRPSAHDQLHSVHSFHHDSVKKFNPNSSTQFTPGKEFTLPNSKMVPTGGSFNVAQVPNLQQGFKLEGGRSGSFRRSSSMTSSDIDFRRELDFSDVCVLSLPGLNGDSIANSHFEHNKRLFLRSGSVITEVCTNINSCLLGLPSCDETFNKQKCKWKVVSASSLQNGSQYVSFVVQVFLSHKSGGYVLECCRREGDSVLYAEVWTSLKRMINEKHGLLINAVSSLDPKIQPPMLSRGDCPPMTPCSIGCTTLDPLLEMVKSNKLEQLVNASQLASKIAANATGECRGKLVKHELTDALFDVGLELVVKSIDEDSKTNGTDIPYGHAIQRNIALYLATLSEDPLVHSKLLVSPSAINFAVACVIIQTNVNSNNDHLYIEAKRECARAIANLLSGADSDKAREMFQACNVKFIGKWAVLMKETKDEKLKMQTERVWERVWKPVGGSKNW